MTKLRIFIALWRMWRRYPHYRFGQLVVNALGVDPFYAEDAETVRLLNGYSECFRASYKL